MPCDTIQLNAVEVGKMDASLLRAALVYLGATNINATATGAWFTLDGQTVRIAGGRVIVPLGHEGIADRVKQAYSREVTVYAARKNGWTVREVRPFVFAVTK